MNSAEAGGARGFWPGGEQSAYFRIVKFVLVTRTFGHDPWFRDQNAWKGEVTWDLYEQTVSKWGVNGAAAGGRARLLAW